MQDVLRVFESFKHSVVLCLWTTLLLLLAFLGATLDFYISGGSGQDAFYFWRRLFPLWATVPT